MTDAASDPVVDTDQDVDAPSDAELISRVRGGDVTAYGELFARHRDAANRLARQLVRGPDSDDLVAEAFAKVLTVLQGGGGPDVAFRAYLLTAVRRLHIDRVRSGQRLQTSDDMTQFDPGVPFQDTAVASFDNGAAAKAFASLPERWQLVLWHLEVERNKPADIAPLLGMSPNSVSALAYRAREGLRQAFLTMHLSDISDSECRWVNEHLGAFVRKGLAKRDATKVRGHLEGCRRCTAMYVELEEVNSNLAAIIAPLLLGTAAAGYLASVGAGATAVGAVGGLSQLGSHAASRAKDFVVANTGAATAAGIAATVAAAAVVAVAVGPFGGDKPSVVADPGSGLSSSVPLGSASPSVLGPLPSLTPSPSATSSVTPSAGVPVSPGASLSLLPSSLPTSTSTTPVFVPPAVRTTPRPTSTPGGAATTPVPSRSPSSTPGVRPSTTPTPTSTASPTQAAGDPGPAVVADPVLVDDGSLQVRARNLRSGDRLDVVLRSADTTFPAALGAAGCHRVSVRHVSCTPRTAARLGVARVAAVDAVAPSPATGRVSASLPLVFPDYMVTDDIAVTATVGDVTTTIHQAAFRPSRTPTYDFTAPVLDAGPHTVGAAGDDYAFTTTATLPPRVTGLVYTVTGAGAHFLPGDSRCTATAQTLSCPTVVAGDRVSLLVGVPGLTGPATIQVSDAPLDAFTDPVPDNATTSVDVAPGADLGLALRVQSAPDRTARVTLSGELTGSPPGLGAVVYTLDGAATWPADGNGACTPDGPALTCPSPVNGPLTLTVVATSRNVSSPLTVSAAPGGAFRPVGLGPHAATVELPSRPVDDLSLAGLALADGPAGHTVVGTGAAALDRYTLATSVGGQLADAPVELAVAGASFAADQPEPGCTRAGGPDGAGQLTCTGLRDGAALHLVVDATATAVHDVTVTAQPGDPYDDPAPEDNTQALSVVPGAALTLAPQDLGPLHQDADGTYPVRVHVSGLRTGLGTVRLALPAAVSVADSTTSGCAVAAAGDLVCTGLADGDAVAFTVRSGSPATATGLAVTATPGDGFEQVGGDPVATGSLVPAHDFSIGDLTQTGHALAGGTDTYELRSTVAALPGGLDALDFTLTGGGGFAAGQDVGCSRTDDTHVHCTGLHAGGAVTFRVDSTATTAHTTGIRLTVPPGYDDPEPADDAATAPDLRPGVDLHLADLHPDNASPADDDRHVLSTALTGVRAGLGAVTWTLTGDAAFSRISTPGCDVAARSVTCPDPADGPVDVTVTADDAHTATPVTIGVEPADPFVELADADNADAATLAARPTYDFGIGTLTSTAHTVTGDVDHYTLTGTVRALPTGVDDLGLTVAGGTFAAQQQTGCSRVDATTVTCTDLATARAVGLRVDSTATTEHAVTVAVQAPRRYDDPVPTNDQASVTVSPAVDLSLGPLTPHAPVPSAGAYEVTGALHGVRSGPVTLTVSGGATLTDSSCALTSGTVATCAAPTEGQSVRLALRPTSPTASTAVTVRARAATGLEELDDADNTATAVLAPDVVLGGLEQTADAVALATVHATVSGVPAGTTAVRLQLSGTGVGSGATEVHFSLGADGADGEGPVDCRTTDAGGVTRATGVFVTCDHLGGLTAGRFGIVARLAHPHGTATPVTFTVLPVGVDQGPHTDDDTGVLSIR